MNSSSSSKKELVYLIETEQRYSIVAVGCDSGTHCTECIEETREEKGDLRRNVLSRYL